MATLTSDFDTPTHSPTRARVEQSNAWSRNLAGLRVFLRRERRLPSMPLRSIAMTVAWLTLLVMAFGKLTPSPRFILGKGGDHIVSSEYHPLRKASDWLTGRKYAVLTFDDGPEGNGVDQQILEVLRQHHAHAIFFVICNRIDDDTGAIVGQFEREGHLIGNHSFDHLALTREPSSKLAHQIEECSRQLAQITGHRPRFFRPPFGMTSTSVARSVNDAGMQEVLWNANSYDDYTNKSEEIVRHTSVETDDASIILMHEKSVTASVLDRILTDLEREGFHFVLPEDGQPFAAAG